MNEEDSLQISVMQWASYQRIPAGHVVAGKIAEYLLAIPNGGKRHLFEAVKMKRMGTMAGACDLFLAIPAHGWAGLWLELKTAKGRVSPAQAAFMGRVAQAGYRVAVARSLEDVRGVVMDYLRTSAVVQRREA